MANRRAHAVVFGYDFQMNAAIVLMLENIKELQSLRIEGNEEDIELTLNNGKKILAQAKAVENSSSDFSNVRRNLKKALTSLSEGAQRTEVQQLILITNSPNPLNDASTQSVFYGHAHRRYSTLPASAQQMIDGYLASIDTPLDSQQFMIQVVPFETDDEEERYKVVLQVINDFVGGLNANLSPGIGRKLHGIWRNAVFTNSTQKDASIKLDKKSIIWPIIVLETEITRCGTGFIDRFDPGIYDEVTRLYADTINSCCERVDYFTKVIFDFNHFQGTKRSQLEKIEEFVDCTWEQYKADFEINGVSGELLEALTKIVLYNVVYRRITINSIKQGVNL